MGSKTGPPDRNPSRPTSGQETSGTTSLPNTPFQQVSEQVQHKGVDSLQSRYRQATGEYGEIDYLWRTQPPLDYLAPNQEARRLTGQSQQQNNAPSPTHGASNSDNQVAMMLNT